MVWACCNSFGNLIDLFLSESNLDLRFAHFFGDLSIYPYEWRKSPDRFSYVLFHSNGKFLGETCLIVNFVFVPNQFIQINNKTNCSICNIFFNQSMGIFKEWAFDCCVGTLIGLSTSFLVNRKMRRQVTVTP